MSFSMELKNELCHVDINCPEQACYELLGITLFSRCFENNSFTIMSENKFFIKRINNLLDFLNIIDNTDSSYKQKKYRKKIRYFIDIKDSKTIKRLNNILNDSNLTDNLQLKFLSDFIRGIFLACGNISNPSSNYHLEFVIYNLNLLNIILYALNSIKSCDINPSVTVRRNTNIVYIKESENIVDLLTYMGATKSSMNFIQTKMVHEFRNYINRTTNFETANISKTTKAAAEQVKAINKIKNTVGLDSLPNSLKEIAKLRLANPYMSLSELSGCLSKPLSRSGINHRLSKIVDISQKLK